MYVPRGSLNATATDRNNGLYNGGIRVSCVRSDHRGIPYENGIASIGTDRISPSLYVVSVRAYL